MPAAQTDPARSAPERKPCRVNTTQGGRPARDGHSKKKERMRRRRPEARPTPSTSIRNRSVVTTVTDTVLAFACRTTLLTASRSTAREWLAMSGDISVSTEPAM